MGHVVDMFKRARAEHWRVKQAAAKVRVSLQQITPQWTPQTIYDVVEKLGSINAQPVVRPTHLRHYIDALHGAVDDEVRLVFHTPPQHSKTSTSLCALVFYTRRYKGLQHAYVTYSIDRARDVMKKDFIPMLEKLGVSYKVDMGSMTVEFDGGHRRGGNTILFTSTNGKITGYTVSGVALLDDPLKGSEQAYSKRERDNIWSWVHGDLLTREFGGHLSVICLQTRWHTDDPAGRFIDMGWKSIRLPALCDGPDDPNGREIGEPLWPEKQSLESLQRRKEHTPTREWNALYQGNPQPEGGFPFKSFKSYRTRVCPHGESPCPRCPEPVVDLDMLSNILVTYGFDGAGYSSKSNEKADSNVLVRLVTDLENRVTYLDRALHMTCRYTEFIPHLVQMWSMKPAPIVWLTGGQEATVSELTLNALREAAPSLVIDQRPAVKYGDKLQRSMHVQDAWNDHKLLVPIGGNNHIKKVIEEVTGWSGGKNERDDSVDALSSAFLPVYEALHTPAGTFTPLYDDDEDEFLKHMSQRRLTR